MDVYVVLGALASRNITRELSVFSSVINILDRRYLVGRAGVDTIGQPRTILVGLKFETRP